MLSAGPKDLLELCLDMNLLHDGRLDPCDWCGESNCRIGANGDHASYRCKSKNCRCSKSVLSHDNDLFNKKMFRRLEAPGEVLAGPWPLAVSASY